MRAKPVRRRRGIPRGVAHGLGSLEERQRFPVASVRLRGTRIDLHNRRPLEDRGLRLSGSEATTERYQAVGAKWLAATDREKHVEFAEGE